MAAVTAGQRIRASQYNADQDRRRKKYQSADQLRNNNTTLLSSTDLTWTVEANAVYAFDSLILIDANTTADFKYNFLLPAGSGIVQSLWGSGVSNGAGIIDGAIFHDVVTSAGLPAGGANSGTPLSLKPQGLIAIGGTAGTVTFQFAQNTANASNTILKLGSWIELTKVA
jgi:hypothetical protein